MSPSVSPFLLFQNGVAQDAMEFYAGAFSDGRIVSVVKYGAAVSDAEGMVQLGIFEINGLRVMCTDSTVPHEFGFTPSMSLFVQCASDNEIEALVETLSEDGEFLMPLDNYGFSTKFAWFNDRFGVSWQVNLPAE